MRYKSEDDILELVHSFEDATVPREAWKHAEHLTVALYYLEHFDLDEATNRMRSGILKLLSHGFGVDLTKEMPYHETITVFWMRTVAGFNRTKNGASLLDKANEVAERYDKDYPLRHYSREHLFSDKARAEFVEADLMPLSDEG